MSQEVVYPRVVLVGTGAAANPNRCHACIAVQTGPAHTLLLDTGSGVEIVRNIGDAGIDLASIEDVFLSHRHSDHLGGLEMLLLHCGLHALQTGRHARELDIFGHALTLEVGRSLLNGMGSVAPALFGAAGERIDWIALTPGEPQRIHSGVTLGAFAVDHAPPHGSCWGCWVEVDGGGRTWRLVYTGDTRPTPELTTRAAGADILVHECGGLDAAAEFVHHVGHSTAGDAGRLACAAGAGHLILVHIPDDTAAEAMAAEAGRHFSGRVTVARDLDSFSLA